jgi:hypothetical protein
VSSSENQGGDTGERGRDDDDDDDHNANDEHHRASLSRGRGIAVVAISSFDRRAAAFASCCAAPEAKRVLPLIFVTTLGAAPRPRGRLRGTRGKHEHVTTWEQAAASAANRVARRVVQATRAARPRLRARLRGVHLWTVRIHEGRVDGTARAARRVPLGGLHRQRRGALQTRASGQAPTLARAHEEKTSPSVLAAGGRRRVVG